MTRIVLLALGFGVSLALVTGLLRLTGEFTNDSKKDVASAACSLEATTAPQADCSEIRLPAPIPGTHLVAERMVSYEGPFIEDGSDTPVANVAAMIIRNTGTEGIREATVTVDRGEETYEFCLSYILPGMSVLVLESSAAPYFKDGITQFSGWELPMEENNSRLMDISLDTLGMGEVIVTNITSKPIENIRLYHKNILQDSIFVGGITYMSCIDVLMPGQTEVILPDHYANGYSKIFYAE